MKNLTNFEKKLSQKRSKINKPFTVHIIIKNE